MNYRLLLMCCALALAALAAPAAAQGIPAIPAPAPPAVPAAPAAPAVPATPAAPGQVPTIWNKLGITQAGCKRCRERCCASPLGQLLNNMTKPLGLATGGLVPPLCPQTPTADQLANLLAADSNASPGEKVAAGIKADEAGAAARRAAIRYLGTVDCHFFPEAEDALIAGLRNDRNECVRLEAALALGKGCCCTKKTIAALTVSANGSEDGKNPTETSERVKAAAMVALMHCMARGVNEKVEPPLPPERPPEGPAPPERPIASRGGSPVQLAASVRPAAPKDTQGQLVLNAARLLAENAGVNPANRLPPTGQRNVMQLMANAAARQDVREEIPFEEAALASRGRPIPVIVRLGFAEPRARTPAPTPPTPPAGPPVLPASAYLDH